MMAISVFRLFEVWCKIDVENFVKWIGELDCWDELIALRTLMRRRDDFTNKSIYSVRN